MGCLRFFSTPIRYTATLAVPRDPRTGLVADYAYCSLIDRGLPDIRLPLATTQKAGELIPLRSLNAENTILVFQPGILSELDLKLLNIDKKAWTSKPGTIGDVEEVQSFQRWSQTLAYFGFSVYVVSNMPSFLQQRTAAQLNLHQINFLSDVDFLLAQAWHLPIGQLENGHRYYERVTTIVPKHNGVEKIFTGLTHPAQTAEQVMKYLVERHEAQQSLQSVTTSMFSNRK
jgi:peroxiredoxin